MFKFIIFYGLKYKYSYIILLLLNIMLLVLNMYLPFYSGEFIDSLISSSSVDNIKNMSMVILFIMLCITFISIITNILSARLNINIAFLINFNVIEHIKKIDYLFIKQNSSSYLNQRVNEDSNEVSNFVISNSISTIKTIIGLFIGLYMLIKTSSSLSTYLFILVPIYIVIYITFKKPIYKHNYNYKNSLNKLFSAVTNQLDNIKIIKSDVTFSYFEKIFLSLFTDLKRNFYKYKFISISFSSLENITNNMAHIFIYYFGGMEVIKGNISIGTFTIIIVYFNIVIQSINYFLNLGKSYQSAKVSYDRLKEYLNISLENKGNIKTNNIKSINLIDFSFSYIKNKYILKNVNTTLKKNNIYLIVGNNGIGKTTFIDLFTGIITKGYSGKIKINGYDISNLDLYHLRSNHFSIMHQFNILNNISIYDNITEFGKYSFENKINDLQNILNLDKNTILDNSISIKNLSGGERQKIALLKAFVKNKEVLVLDEPTSSLDIITKENVINYIKTIKKDKIIIIVSHDKCFETIADKTINLNNIANN